MTTARGGLKSVGQLSFVSSIPSPRTPSDAVHSGRFGTAGIARGSDRALCVAGLRPLANLPRPLAVSNLACGSTAEPFTLRDLVSSPARRRRKRCGSPCDAEHGEARCGDERAGRTPIRVEARHRYGRTAPDDIMLESQAPPVCVAVLSSCWHVLERSCFRFTLSVLVLHWLRSRGIARPVAPG